MLLEKEILVCQGADATHTWKPSCSNFKVSGFLKKKFGMAPHN
jgi:hypothetical protein